MGKEGRIRPRDPAARRARAAVLLEQHPHASLREIARSVGVSPATVLGVRRRRDKGSPGPGRQNHAGLAPVPRQPASIQDGAEMSMRQLEALRDDPALRYSSSGRNLIRLLSATTTGLRAPEELVRAVPAHSRTTVAVLARQTAACWLRIAEQLDAPPLRPAVIGRTVGARPEHLPGSWGACSDASTEDAEERHGTD